MTTTEADGGTGVLAGEERLLIDGVLCGASAGATFDVINPATEEVAGVAADGGPADFDRAIAAARRAFDANAGNWRDDVEFRAHCVTQLRDGLVRAQERLRRILVTEIGTPVAMTYGIQLAFPIAEAGYWPDYARNFAFLRDAGTHSGLGRTFRQMLQYIPVGVVAAITPWNAPLYLNVAESVPALLAGNAVMLKPAQLTPWAGLELGRIAAEETDIPPGIFQVVVSNDNDVAAVLTSDPRIDMVTFTGSTGVGRKILAAAAPTVKKTVMELGGKSTHIVLDDADLAEVLPLAAGGVCTMSGQGCTLATRILLPRSKMAEGLAIMRATMERFPYGDPWDMKNYSGPAISDVQRAKVLGLIEGAVAAGATLVTGGGQPAHLPTGYYIEPTLLSDVDPRSTIGQEETFGPVVTVTPYDTEEEAVAIANDTIYGLAGQVSSGDDDRALAVALKIRTGTIGANVGGTFSLTSPLGGVRQSGLGRRYGDGGFEEYLEVKAIGPAGLMTDQPALLRPDEHADRAPDSVAVVVPATGRRTSYRTMVDQSKRLANVLRDHGLRPGDHVAIFMTNVPEYFEVVWAARRAGFFYTAISWHLTPGEVRYMLENSQSKALIVSADLADVAEQAAGDRPEPALRLLIGPERPGWDDYAATVAKAGTVPLGPELEGQAMLYSSGTTGRPKGIVHTKVDAGRRFGDVAGDILWVNRYGLDPSAVTLNVGPLYHAAPLVSAMATHRHGGTVVLLPKFDPEQTLHAIEQYRVTYAQFVPTMFIRLLRLPEAVRRRYDVSSLRTVAHSAAPCPVEVKREMIDWFGPVIHEYYSATEAAGHVSISSAEWLEHPGSVGRVAPGSVAITDESGRELPAGQDGIIWFTRPANRFSYHGDPEKSASMYNDQGWARMGDLGLLDRDGYLFITGRSDHTIISGGVNIYPREIEDLLIAHPAVDDVAVIGVPDDEYGESVMAVVTVRDGYAGGATLERDIIDWTRARLAHYKCPRSVTFVDTLPRSVAGKMMKHRLLEQLAQAQPRAEGARDAPDPASLALLKGTP